MCIRDSSITIYVVDKAHHEIYSMFLAGTRLREIRLPISNKSIAGFAANMGVVVNIADAYDQAELKNIDPELSFDYSWDKQSGYKTKQILAAPIYSNNQLMGVIQVLNRRFGVGKFTEDEMGLALEIAVVLGVAFYNQQRFARRRKTRFDYLITRDMLKEEELENAWEESREQKEALEHLLMRKYKISKSDISHAFEEFYRCRFIEYNDKTVISGDLIKNLKKEYLRRELWVPLEKIDGYIHVLVDDPNNVLKRDVIENLLKTKQVKYDVALAEDIIKFINLFFHSSEDVHSFTELLGRLDNEDKTIEDEDSDMVTESDSVITVSYTHLTLPTKRIV